MLLFGNWHRKLNNLISDISDCQEAQESPSQFAEPSTIT